MKVNIARNFLESSPLLFISSKSMCLVSKMEAQEVRVAGSCDLLEVERLYAEFNQVIGSVEQTNCPIVLSEPEPTLFGGKGSYLLFTPKLLTF